MENFVLWVLSTNHSHEAGREEEEGLHETARWGTGVCGILVLWVLSTNHSHVVGREEEGELHETARWETGVCGILIATGHPLPPLSNGDLSWHLVIVAEALWGIKGLWMVPTKAPSLFL